MEKTFPMTKEGLDKLKAELEFDIIGYAYCSDATGLEYGAQIEIEVNGYFAFIDYKETSTQIALTHTEADEALAGTGAAKAVVKKTLEFIKNTGKKLLPFCPFVFHSLLLFCALWRTPIVLNP